jgi:hypothetical protein
MKKDDIKRGFIFGTLGMPKFPSKIRYCIVTKTNDDSSFTLTTLTADKYNSLSYHQKIQIDPKDFPEIYYHFRFNKTGLPVVKSYISLHNYQTNSTAFMENVVFRPSLGDHGMIQLDNGSMVEVHPSISRRVETQMNEFHFNTIARTQNNTDYQRFFGSDEDI